MARPALVRSVGRVAATALLVVSGLAVISGSRAPASDASAYPAKVTGTRQSLGGDSGRPQAPISSAPDRRGSPASSDPTYSSPGYAGYSDSRAKVARASTTFIVPDFSCPAKGDYGIVPGVILGGEDYLGAGVLIDCQDGATSLQAVAFYDGPFDALNVQIAEGDTVTVSVSLGSTSTASVEDVTGGGSADAAFPSVSADYADIGDDSTYLDYTQLGVPTFDPIAFSAAGVGTGAVVGSGVERVEMGNGTTSLVDTSALGDKDTAFTTTFGMNAEPTIVQGRVIEGVDGARTLSATLWPATFLSTGGAPFSASISWGDGSSPTTGTITKVGSSSCTYSPLSEPGSCYAIAARHVYQDAGDYAVTAAVTSADGTDSATGLAEIVAPDSQPAEDSIGVLTWNEPAPGVDMCTATALANTDLVLTAKHCFHDLSEATNFEFAPQHTGNCGEYGHMQTVAECEASGAGHDPYGYWSGAAAGSFPSSVDNDTIAGHDTVLVALGDMSSEGYSLTQAIGGLPVHFDATHGSTTYSTWGYPGRTGDWTRNDCIGAKDLSTGKDSVIGIQPCDLGGAGVSGSPFVSGRWLPDAVSGTDWFSCPPQSYCHQSGVEWTNTSSTAIDALADPLANPSMQAYIAAVLAG